MAESLVNKTLALGGCLLFDFLKGESAAAANRSICSVIGDKSLSILECDSGSIAFGKAIIRLKANQPIFKLRCRYRESPGS
ncbi:hypothetical protein B9Z55_013942 [Caenorhabditis nigoni]|uniref:Mos1 transposase HTH domain-containing protein n=1 Tax=Caenorhabditis nigoni TaxID=1611254 RepID=A0A2G5U3V7_9PELO|nr:hypothetical protein B9Z55_013942 [Caenorhabditis nigoni]